MEDCKVRGDSVEEIMDKYKLYESWIGDADVMYQRKLEFPNNQVEEEVGASNNDNDTILDVVSNSNDTCNRNKRKASIHKLVSLVKVPKIGAKKDVKLEVN